MVLLLPSYWGKNLVSWPLSCLKPLTKSLSLSHTHTHTHTHSQLYVQNVCGLHMTFYHPSRLMPLPSSHHSSLSERCNRLPSDAPACVLGSRTTGYLIYCISDIKFFICLTLKSDHLSPVFKYLQWFLMPIWRNVLILMQFAPLLFFDIITHNVSLSH